MPSKPSTKPLRRSRAPQARHAACREWIGSINRGGIFAAGCVLEFSGRPMEALPHLDAILRLDPRYRFRSLAIADQSLCQLLLSNLDEAISTAEQAVRTQAGNVRARQRLVAALSLRGLDDKPVRPQSSCHACSPRSISPT